MKFEVRNKNEAEMFQSFLVFFLVTAGTICVRLSTIFSNHVWLDDIQQKHNLAVGSMMSPRVFLYSKVHLWALENLHPSIIRMGYVFLYGATAVLVAKLLRKILVRKWDAEIISVVAFLAPTTSIVFVFINGSYNVLFLLTYVLLISVLVKLFSTRKENQRLYLHQLAIAGLVFLAIGTTTNGVLLLGLLFLLPWWSSPLRENPQVFRKHFFCSGALVCAGIVYGLYDIVNKHPYLTYENRVTYNPFEIMQNVFRYIGIIVSSYLDPLLRTPQRLFSVISNRETAISAVLVAALLAASLIVRKKIHGMFFSKGKNLFLPLYDVLPFISCASLVAAIGVATGKLVHLWHYFLPGILLVFFVTFIGATALPRKIFYPAVLLLLVLSVNSYKQQNEAFGIDSEIMSDLEELFEEEVSQWPDEMDLFVVTPLPPNAGIHTSNRGVSFVTNYVPQANLRSATFGSLETVMKAVGDLEEVTVDNARIYIPDSATDQWEQLSLSEGTYENLTFEHVKKGLCGSAEDGLLLVNLYEVSDFFDLHGVLEFQTTFDSVDTFEISLEPSTIYSLSISLTPEEGTFRSENDEFSETTPPMPFLGSNLLVYQRSEGYDIRGRESGKDVLREETAVAEIKMFGCEGQSAFASINDRGFFEVLPSQVSGEWFAGRGWKDRFWEGVSSFELKSFK